MIASSTCMALGWRFVDRFLVTFAGAFVVFRLRGLRVVLDGDFTAFRLTDEERTFADSFTTFRFAGVLETFAETLVTFRLAGKDRTLVAVAFFVSFSVFFFISALSFFARG